MSCAACSARVEKAVGALEGVAVCEVNLLLGSMSVTGEVGSEKIIDAVRAAGYDAAPDTGEAEHMQQKERTAKGGGKPILLRLISSLAFLIPLMYISMGHLMWGLPLPRNLAGNPIAIGLTELILSAVIMVINKDFYLNGTRGIVHGAPNMDTLVSLGSAASFVYSVCLLYMISADVMAADIASAAHRLHGLYFESAAMILVLITVGKYLEALAKGRTTSAIESLMNLAPKMATVERDGEKREIPASEIMVDDIFIVKRGDSIPADGVIESGEISVDESALTGESIPSDKSSGGSVYGATSVLSGYARVRAVKVGEHTAMAKIIEMVKNAAGSKAPVAKAADKVSGIFVPAVIAISLITFGIWMLCGAGFNEALTHAVSVLVVSCPCALGLATPVAIMVGSGVGAKRGILFKNATALELSGKISVVAFDKTGTITKGRPSVCGVIPVSCSEEELLRLAASIEAKSEHPLARAITEHTSALGIAPEQSSRFTQEQGGLSALIGDKLIFAGNRRYAEQKCTASLDEELARKFDELSLEGKTVIILATADEILGLIAINDEIREDSAFAVRELHEMGISTVMITGDNSRCAEFVGARVGIDKVISEVMPDGKADAIRSLKGKRLTVAMVGDGINDSVALTEADVGISVGSGTDVAIDSADVVLTGSSLCGVASAVRLGRRTLLNIYENLFWAFCYNIIGIPLAAGAFIPLLGWGLEPMFGAAAMSISSFVVVMNSLRLNLYNPTNISAKKKTNICKKENKMKKLTIKIEGMMCPHCSGRVKGLLLENPAVAEADVSHERGDAIITLSQDVERSVLEKIITDAGYKVVG